MLPLPPLPPADSFPSAAGLPPCRLAVVSMGRSGTSLMGRLLNDLLAVDFGDASDHLGADAANPDGYYELRALVDLDQRLLGTLGGSVASPPQSEFFVQATESQRNVWREQAQATLAPFMVGRPRFGVKDPRMALLMPLWRAAFPDLRCVVMCRHPSAVAKSAAAQLGVSAADVLPLWSAYYQRIFEHTAGMPRQLVSFEQLLTEPETVFKRVAAFVGVGEAHTLDGLAQLPAYVRAGQSKHAPDAALRLDARTAALWELFHTAAERGEFPSEPAYRQALSVP